MTSLRERNMGWEHDPLCPPTPFTSAGWVEEQFRLVPSVRKRGIIIMWGRAVALGPCREAEQPGTHTLLAFLRH